MQTLKDNIKKNCADSASPGDLFDSSPLLDVIKSITVAPGQITMAYVHIVEMY